MTAAEPFVYAVSNLEHVRSDSAFARACEAIASAVGDSGAQLLASLDAADEAPGDGWIVFGGSNFGRGAAINVHQAMPSETRMARALSMVRIASALKPFVSDGIVLTDCTAPPHEWRVANVPVGRKSLWISLSDETAVTPLPAEPSGRACAHGGALRIEALLHVSCMPSTGDVIDISAARIRFPDLNVHCVFAMWQEGRIVMESERAGGSTNAGDVPVRIDLGSVELSAADIADLRRGSKLELEAEGLLRCFLRIGNRTFAEGALSVTGDGLTVTVQKILQD